MNVLSMKIEKMCKSCKRIYVLDLEKEDLIKKGNSTRVECLNEVTCPHCSSTETLNMNIVIEGEEELPKGPVYTIGPKFSYNNEISKGTFFIPEASTVFLDFKEAQNAARSIVIKGLSIVGNVYKVLKVDWKKDVMTATPDSNVGFLKSKKRIIKMND